MNPGGAPSTGRSSSRPATGTAGHGVFNTVDEAVRAARGAFVAMDGITLDARMRIIEAIRVAMREQADPLARFAWEETGLGRYEDKIAKNLLVTNMTPGPEVLVPYAKSGDGLTLESRSLQGDRGDHPDDEPNLDDHRNTIGMLSAGNSVVFNVHEREGSRRDGPV